MAHLDFQNLVAKSLKAATKEFKYLIHPSKSPWTSPLDVVSKYNGEYRLCAEGVNPLTAAGVYIRLTQPMRSLPPAYIYAFPKYDPLHCATIKKTTPTTLECHKMTLTSDESDLDDYFPSSSGSETSEYDITSNEEDSDCGYSLKDA
ncbi:hypothetical protein NPIL_416711 [Nephila pilipes]|uniref:Uncharacterized protein n=1 Tax=Nephila pilipes TaxID=299642 RepID=A0A8X6P1I8_NEPPI|nr:hypothetical protein NPIL_416711 [Nephila pilipes]